MRYKKLSAVVLSIGIVFVVCSFAVRPFLDAVPQWTDEKARQYEDATMRVHELSYRYGVPTKRSHHLRGAMKQTEAQEFEELIVAEREYDRLRSQLDTARWRGKNWPRILRWSGASFIVVGMMGYVFGSMRKEFAGRP